MRSIVKSMALLASVALFSYPEAALAQLQYQVERPFRFFKYESDYAIQKIAFDLLKGADKDPTKVTVERLERELANPLFWKHEFPPIPAKYIIGRWHGLVKRRSRSSKIYAIRKSGSQSNTAFGWEVLMSSILLSATAGRLC